MPSCFEKCYVQIDKKTWQISQKGMSIPLATRTAEIHLTQTDGFVGISYIKVFDLLLYIVPTASV